MRLLCDQLPPATVRIVFAIVVWLFAWSTTQAVVDSNWTREFHPKKQIQSVHVRDTIGVSADDSNVVVWDTRDGRRIDSMNFSDRGVGGAWLSTRGDQVIVFVQDKAALTWGMVYWFDLKTHASIDSIGPFFSQQYGDHYDCQGVYGGMSDNDSLLYINYKFHTYRNGHIDVWRTNGQMIDVARHTTVGDTKEISWAAPPRFEARNTVITFVPQLDPTSESLRSTSPTGTYLYDGKDLYNVQRNSLVRRATQQRWYVANYGPDDATILGLRHVDVYDSLNQLHLFYRLCVVDVFRDSVLQVVDSIENGGVYTWCDSRGRTVYLYGQGSVRKSVVDTSVYHTRTSCIISLPDSVVADTLYLIGAEVFPRANDERLIFDKGDGTAPTMNLYCSWSTSGTYTCRAGVVKDQDTTWVCSRTIKVRQHRVDSRATTRFYVERAAIQTIDVTHSESMLVACKNGWIIAFDSLLSVKGCAKAPYQTGGACWTATNEVQCLLYDVTSYVPYYPKYDYVTRIVNAIAGTVDLSSATLIATDTMKCSGEVGATNWNVDYTVRTLGANRSETMYNLVSIFSTGGSERNGMGTPPTISGGINSVQSGQFKKVGSTSSGTYPALNYYGQYLRAGMSSDGKHIVGLFYDYMPTAWWQIKRFALFDIAADSIVALIKGFDVSEIQCIGSDFAVADSTWIDISPFRVAERHAFIGPFAEDAVPDHAIAWKDGWFYSFHPNGRIHDSVQADTMRPTVIRVFKDGRIIAGYASGLVGIYGEGKRDITSVEPSSGESTEILHCWPNPTSSTLHCQLDTSMSLPATLEIFDMQGRLCGTTTLDSRDADVNLRTLMNMEATGLFVVRVRTDATLSYSKVVLVK
jgi:hypothetical protein